MSVLFCLSQEPARSPRSSPRRKPCVYIYRFIVHTWSPLFPFNNNNFCQTQQHAFSTTTTTTTFFHSNSFLRTENWRKKKNRKYKGHEGQDWNHTNDTQMTHKWHTNDHKWHTNDTQMTHKWHTNDTTKIWTATTDSEQLSDVTWRLCWRLNVSFHPLRFHSISLYFLFRWRKEKYIEQEKKKTKGK